MELVAALNDGFVANDRRAYWWSWAAWAMACALLATWGWWGVLVMVATCIAQLLDCRADGARTRRLHDMLDRHHNEAELDLCRTEQRRPRLEVN